MNSVACDELESRGTIARYVAGTLAEAESAAFEDHFLTCDRCQASVRAGLVVRQTAVPRPARRTSRALWLAGGGTLAAAALAGVLIWQNSPTAELRAFGHVDVAPIYLGAPVRAYQTGEFALFDSAMAQYAAGRYQDAASLLEQARATGVQDAALDFFLGASYLLAAAPDRAEPAFTAVIDDGANLYVGEAHFYRAKARLQRGDRSGALSDLRAAAAQPGAIAQPARALLQQLET